MNSSNEPFHVAFLPYLAPGHIMPMVGIARLFSTHTNISSAIITTPENANRFKSTIDQDFKSGRRIYLRILPFPSAQKNLPEGCENISKCSTPEETIKLFDAINLLQPEIESLLKEMNPDCIFSDVLYPWTTDLASDLGIPRLAFSGSGFFNLSVSHAVEKYEPHNDTELEHEDFIVPSLPDKVLLTRSQLPDIVKTKTKTKFTAMFERLKESEKRSFGMVVNSFHELESAYADYYRESIGIKAWNIGPVSLFDRDHKTDTDVSNRHHSLFWLDHKREKSVLYLCFGSLVRLSKAQIVEIVSALEDSSCCFIWSVAKTLEKEKGEEEWWLPKGFEEKMEQSGKGMVIKGWAPQVPILEHPSIGGFLTHCGWNSVLEGVTAGVPMLTWPIIADQFYNEKLITQILKCGVPVGNEVWKVWATEETPLIGREKIKFAVDKVMDSGAEAERMRSIVKKLSQSARMGVEEGGLSHNDLKILIQDIVSYRHK